ncbi:hypothetical protein EON65_43700 [archaeon]|nr:MAG: hypothetical protein EON65_43700 [archaeon]
MYILIIPIPILVTLSVVPLIGVGAMTLAKYARALNSNLRNAHSKLLSHSLDRVSIYMMNGVWCMEYGLCMLGCVRMVHDIYMAYSV